VDHKEGAVSGLFVPFPVKVRDAQGSELAAVAYRAADDRRLPAEAPPSAGYLETLRRGARDAGLSEEWQARLHGLGADPDPVGAAGG
jgi:hypothetical protein